MHLNQLRAHHAGLVSIKHLSHPVVSQDLAEPNLSGTIDNRADRPVHVFLGDPHRVRPLVMAVAVAI